MLVFVNRELGNLGLRDYDALLAAERLILRLNVAKCPRHTEAARQYSVWSIEHLTRLAGHLAELIRDGNGLVCLSLIHLATVVLYPVEFIFLIGSMVLRQLVNAKTIFCRHDSATVADIGNEALRFDGQDDNGAGAGLVDFWVLHCQLQESFLGNAATIRERLPRVLRKTILSYDNLVQVIFEKVGAITATVAVINGEEGALGPRSSILVGWPRHIQNN